MQVNLEKTKHIHFVGIKGVGMTALALCAQDMGIKVTGSDVKEIFVTDKTLKENGIVWSESFTSTNIGESVDLVIATGSFGGIDNPEIRKANDLGLPVIMQGEAMGLFSRGKKLIGVCGVGGKSTTSAMIATILEESGSNPSYAIGVGEIFPIGAPGKYVSNSNTFICEADEYINFPGEDNTPKFLYLEPFIGVVTNIAYDHPDVYPTFDDTQSAYARFFKKIHKDGHLIVSADDQASVRLAKKMKRKFLTYGFNPKADLYITNRKVKDGQQIVLIDDTMSGDRLSFSLNIPGEYNVRNAAAAYLAAKQMGVPSDKILSALEKFLGTKRRFERVGKTQSGALVIDDYAHHPSEIESLVKATREFYPGKTLTLAFQPHTYSRTKALFNDFTKSLSLADRVCLIEIYSSAREKKDPSVSSEKLALEIKKLNKNTFYLGGIKEAAIWLKENVQKDEVLLIVGAGDIFYMHKELLSK